MSISPTTTEIDLLKHGWAIEHARRVDIAESLAASIYPWPALEFEIRAQEVVGGFPPHHLEGRDRQLLDAGAIAGR